MKTFNASPAALLVLLASTAAATDLEVTITGVAHERGNVRICLYDGPEGFRHEDKSLWVLEQPAVKGTLSARFSQLPPGRYAVIAYHDENGDGALNRFLGMVPTEGYGLSNNPKLMGPPKFDQAALDVPAEGGRATIHLNY